MNEFAVLRAEYAAAGLAETDLTEDPFALFRAWFAQAAPLPEPNAMVLATADADGRPSVRTVLLKGLDERGFSFFSNYDSRKGRELAANPACALLFPWHALQRQVRVEGRAERLPEPESSAYFSSRPRGAQLGAWASPQSRPADAEQLAASYADADRRFPGEVPRPAHWGGYVVVPEAVEFWQGRPNRMHDRWVYRRSTAGRWRAERLAP
jgi:pyridoxamine 5'-phosphate oxidase